MGLRNLGGNLIIFQSADDTCDFVFLKAFSSKSVYHSRPPPIPRTSLFYVRLHKNFIFTNSFTLTRLGEVKVDLADFETQIVGKLLK